MTLTPRWKGIMFWWKLPIGGGPTVKRPFEGTIAKGNSLAVQSCGALLLFFLRCLSDLVAAQHMVTTYPVSFRILSFTPASQRCFESCVDCFCGIVDLEDCTASVSHV